MKIEIIDPDPLANTTLFRQVIEQVTTSEDKRSEYINVVFMKRDELRLLKKQYFEKDVYTDVVTFNLNDPIEPLEGEIYLSFDQIKQNAKQYKTEIQDELYRVLIHGCLHLCGYEDDTVDHKATMTSLEDRYLAQIENLML